MTTVCLGDHHQSLESQTLQPFVFISERSEFEPQGSGYAGRALLGGCARWRGQSLSSGMNVAIAPVENDAEKVGWSRVGWIRDLAGLQSFRGGIDFPVRVLKPLARRVIKRDRSAA